MDHFKVIIAYDGTAYHGWQYQPGLPTVAGQLQETFKQVFGIPITLKGASRTDAGVHALGQVATFSLAHHLHDDIRKIAQAWNNRLSPDILIRSLHTANSDFNVFIADQKTYYYHLFFERPLPFATRYGWYYYKSLSLEKFSDALSLFIGTHDFKAFSTGDDRGADTIRTVTSIEMQHFKRWGFTRVKVQGPKFLHHMIRRIVGASLDVASRKHLSVDYLYKVLNGRCPSSLLTNAPAQGLMLYSIDYKDLE